MALLEIYFQHCIIISIVCIPIGQSGSHDHPHPPPRLNGLTGDQLPPPGSDYFTWFHKCGIPNICPDEYEGKDPRCFPDGHGRRKRSVLRPPHHRRRQKAKEGKDYRIDPDYADRPVFASDIKYPWIGIIERYNSENEVYEFKVGWDGPRLVTPGVWTRACSLTLISPLHALTTIHCVTESVPDLEFDDQVYNSSFKIWKKKTWKGVKQEKFEVDAFVMRAIFGPMHVTQNGSDLLIFDEAYARRIAAVHIPPAGPKLNYHDLAMVEFDIGLKYNKHIRSICLPIHGFPIHASDLEDGRTFVLGGYESENDHTPSQWEEDRPFAISEKDIKQPPLFKNSANGKLFVTPRNEKSTYFKFELVHRHQLQSWTLHGPIMWYNNETSRYTLVGVFIQMEDDRRTAYANKVHQFMLWIIHTLKPISDDAYDGAGGKYPICLHKDCKQPIPLGSVSRTWILNINSTSSNEQRLATPCQFVPEMKRSEKFICPVFKDKESSEKRELVLLEKQLNGFLDDQKNDLGYEWRFCTTRRSELYDCTYAGDKGDRHQTSKNYLDELTLGSFSQKRYHGFETPPIPHSLGTIFAKPKIVPDPTPTNYCDLNNDGGHSYCPVTSRSGSQCLLSETICDGFNDCEDGWDESPHLCIGKCDYWKQYVFPDLAYNYDEPPDFMELTTQHTAQDCYEHCKVTWKCTHWNWWGVGGQGFPRQDYYPDGKMCQVFQGYNTSDPDALVRSRNHNKEYVIRGPRYCKHLFESVEDHVKCSPVYGPPMRTGVFLIQGYTGQYLQQKAKDENQNKDEPRNLEPRLVTVTAEEATELDEIFWNNPNQWLFTFVGTSKFVSKNYYLISEFKKETIPESVKYLTFNSQSDQKIVTLEPLQDETHERTQRWYIKPTNEENGYIEAKIYAKLGTIATWFLTVPTSHGEKFPDLHARFPDEVNHSWDNDTTVLYGNKKDKINEDDKPLQTFRFLECDYGYNSGQRIAGVSKRKPAGDDGLGAIFKEIFTDKFVFPHEMNFTAGEFIFMDLFGLSHARYYMLYENMILGTARAHKQIVDTMKESSTIFDYAGRMRIKHSRIFTNMYETWNKFADKSNPAENCFWYQCKLLLPKLRDYIKQKVKEDQFMVTPGAHTDSSNG